MIFEPPVVWPCAAGMQNAYLFGTVPPFLNKSTLTFSVAADAGAVASAMPTATIPISVSLTLPMFSSLLVSRAVFGIDWYS